MDSSWRASVWKSRPWTLTALVSQWLKMRTTCADLLVAAGTGSDFPGEPRMMKYPSRRSETLVFGPDARHKALTDLGAGSMRARSRLGQGSCSRAGAGALGSKGRSGDVRPEGHGGVESSQQMSKRVCLGKGGDGQRGDLMIGAPLIQGGGLATRGGFLVKGPVYQQAGDDMVRRRAAQANSVGRRGCRGRSIGDEEMG